MSKANNTLIYLYIYIFSGSQYSLLYALKRSYLPLRKIYGFSPANFSCIMTESKQLCILSLYSQKQTRGKSVYWHFYAIYLVCFPLYFVQLLQQQSVVGQEQQLITLNFNQLVKEFFANIICEIFSSLLYKKAHSKFKIILRA